MSDQQAAGKAISIDLGGTRFRVAVGNSRGEIEWRTALPTLATQGPNAVMERIFVAVEEAMESLPYRSDLKGISVDAPGPVDPWRGVVYNPPNLPGWADVPVKELFEKRFGVPTTVGNDANLAAVGEHRFGAGKGLRDIVYVTVSTGIGGGVIADDRLLLGFNGFAGEIGHMTIDMHGPVCNCGNTGCLEVLASGTGVARRAREMVASGAATKLSELPASELTAKKVSDLADQGDEVSREIIREAGVALGVGMVNLTHLFNPQRVIMGGGFSNAGPLLWDTMREILRARAITDQQKAMEIVPAALGDDAGLLGGIAAVLLG